MQRKTYHLEQLRRALVGVKRARIATQQDIAKHLGIPQSTVSRALTGTLKRETSATRRLFDYANMLVSGSRGNDRLERAVGDYLRVGGNPDVLADLVEAAANAFPPR